jgi:hypothetical protein
MEQGASSYCFFDSHAVMVQYSAESLVQLRDELAKEIYAKLWPFRRQRVTATGAFHPILQDSLDATADETAEDARKQYERLLAAHPEIAATALGSEQLRDHVQVKLKDLLAKYQKVITPTSPSVNCATHVRCPAH